MNIVTHILGRLSGRTHDVEVTDSKFSMSIFAALRIASEEGDARLVSALIRECKDPSAINCYTIRQWDRDKNGTKLTGL